MPVFFRDPDDGLLKKVAEAGIAETLEKQPTSWRRYDRKVKTAAIRIDGLFHVNMDGTIIPCEDGWLAVDALGDPYPIDAVVFDKTYLPA